MGRGEALLAALERFEALQEAAVEDLHPADDLVFRAPALRHAGELRRRHVGLAGAGGQPGVGIPDGVPLAQPGIRRGRPGAGSVQGPAQRVAVGREPLKRRYPPVDREDAHPRARGQDAIQVSQRGLLSEAAGGRTQAVEGHGHESRRGRRRREGGRFHGAPLDEVEGIDGLPDAVLVDLQVGGGQAAQDGVLLVPDDDVHLHALGADRERGRGDGALLGRHRERGSREEEDGGKRSHQFTFSGAGTTRTSAMLAVP